MPARRLALLAALLALALTGGSAHARHQGEPFVLHYLRDDGTGMLWTLVDHPVAWERCAPDGSPCTSYDDGDGEPKSLAVRDDPPGTVFAATQDGVTLRSEPWRGRVRATEPPRVEGEVRVGGLVRPLPATWEGGWGREADWLQLQACRTLDGADCVVVLDERSSGPCRSDGGRLLPARYEGRWLQVTDRRISREEPYPLPLYSPHEANRPHVPGPPGIAGAVVGQIAPGPAPAEDCGQPRGFLPPGSPPAPGCSRTQAQQPATQACTSPVPVSPVRVSRVLLTRTRLSLRVSRPADLDVRIARRAGRPSAARWRRVKSLTLRARAAGPATRRLRPLRPGRYRISIRSDGGSSMVLERTLRRTPKR